MSHHHDFDSKPPEAPPFKRKLRFYFYQFFGLPFLLLIPLLAILGIFDQTMTQQEKSSDESSIRIDYPSHYRYDSTGTISIHVQNKSDETISLLSIEIDKDYIEHFFVLRATPEESQISAETYIIELTDILPGTSQLIKIDLQAKDFGEHSGFIVVKADGIEQFRFPMNSFTFP